MIKFFFYQRRRGHRRRSKTRLSTSTPDGHEVFFIKIPCKKRGYNLLQLGNNQVTSQTVPPCLIKEKVIIIQNQIMIDKKSSQYKQRQYEIYLKKKTVPPCELLNACLFKLSLYFLELLNVLRYFVNFSFFKNLLQIIKKH